MVASGWPCRLALAASIRVSAFDVRIGARDRSRLSG